MQEDDSLPQNVAREHSSRPSHNDGETETVADSVALSDDISSEISDDNDD